MGKGTIKTKAMTMAVGNVDGSRALPVDGVCGKQ